MAFGLVEYLMRQGRPAIVAFRQRLTLMDNELKAASDAHPASGVYELECRQGIYMLHDVLKDVRTSAHLM